MKSYQVQIVSHYVTSVKVNIIADCEKSAIIKAKEIFTFCGSDRHVKVKLLG